MNSLRTVVVTLLAAALLSTAVGSASAEVTVEVVPDTPGTTIGELTPGTDGTMWAAQVFNERTGPSRYVVVRLTADGVVSQSELPSDLFPFDSNGVLHVLSDGTIGLIARRYQTVAGTSKPNITGVALERFSPDGGTILSTRELPAETWSASGFAFAPDGAIWFARSCDDEVRRLAADGSMRRVRLPSLGCGRQSLGREQGAGLAFDARGSLWLVNRCMGRVDRISLTGKVREWWTPRSSCPYDAFDRLEATPQPIAVAPHGGISFDALTATPGNTRGRHAQGSRFPAFGTGVFASDGALWSVASSITRRDPDGSVRTFTTTRALGSLGLALARDGSPWLLQGRYVPGDYRQSGWHEDEQLTSLTPVREQPLGPAPPVGGSTRIDDTGLALGPDGALWIHQRGTIFQPAAPDHTAPPAIDVARVMRVVSDSLTPVASPVTKVATVLRRVRRTLWLQLSCDATRARFCRGSATLARTRLVTGSQSFAIAGGTSAAVPLTLSVSAVRALRRGSVTVDALVAVEGGPPARKTIRVPGRQG